MGKKYLRGNRDKRNIFTSTHKNRAFRDFPDGPVVENPPCNAEDRDPACHRPACRKLLGPCALEEPVCRRKSSHVTQLRPNADK